jgi:uncharacterized protein (DUF2062 family)
VRRLRQIAQLLFRIEDSPHRIALAFALGVFIAFFPILGIHTGLALLIAFAFRLSRLAMLAGCWVNNPWTIAPMYTTGTLLGCALLGVPSEGLGSVRWDLKGDAFYASLWQGLRPFVMPYVVGNLVLGLLCGALVYGLLRSALQRRQRRALVNDPGYNGGRAR